MFSPNAGSLNSITDPIPYLLSLSFSLERSIRLYVRNSTDSGVDFFRINSQVLNRLFQQVKTDFIFSSERTQRGQDNMLRINLKEIAQSGSILTAAKAICSERDQLSRHPLGQGFRQHLHVVRRGDKRPG